MRRVPAALLIPAILGILPPNSALQWRHNNNQGRNAS
jgi:hypothetical protein